jgi:hypoxanthine-DNA glycosylase
VTAVPAPASATATATATERATSDVATRLQGLPPVVSPDTRLLILGSFPGRASLAAQAYYAHPRNHFWRILQALWPAAEPLPGPEHYPQRLRWLLARGLGLWDVYASCEREGSLDTAIRAPVVNDFAALRLRCPLLTAVAHNGSESYRHAARVRDGLAPDTVTTPLPVYRLPSTSPAHASWSFDRKLQAWRAVLGLRGLIAD